MIIYIHGFGSSGISSKATILKENLKEFDDLIAPSLSYVPNLAIDTLNQIIFSYKKYEDVYLVGTSLGGYYATYLSEYFNIPAVLINPAVNPTKTLRKLTLLGGVNHYDKSRFTWSLDYLEQLKQFDIKNVSYKNYMLLLQKGDKVLDYKEAVEKFRDSKIIIEDGGTHRFENIENHIESMIDFFIDEENVRKCKKSILQYT